MNTSDFKCNCATTIIAKRYLAGEATLTEVRRALEEHWNHACSDFMLVYELYTTERRDKKDKNEVIE